MKKFWIITACAILVLAAALLVCSIVFREKEIPSNDIEGQYPYSYSETKDGMKITVKGPFPEGSVWTGSSSDTDVLMLTEKMQDTKEAIFLMQPVGTGSAAVTLFLGDSTNAMADPSYLISLQLFVASDRTISVFSESHAIPEKSLGGESEKFCYRIQKVALSYEVIVYESQVNDWIPVVSGDRITAEMKSLLEDSCEMTVSGGPMAKGTVRLCSSTAGQCIVLNISYDTQGLPSVQSYEVLPWDPQKTLQEDPEEYRRSFGLPKIPEEAELLGSGVELRASGRAGDTFVCGWVRFRLSGIEWMLYTAKERDVMEFAEDASLTASAQEDVLYYGVEATAYAVGEGALGVWEKNGRTWCLQGEKATKEQILDAMDPVMRATIYG